MSRLGADTSADYLSLLLIKAACIRKLGGQILYIEGFDEAESDEIIDELETYMLQPFTAVIQNYETNQINVPNAIRITALTPPLLSCRSSSSSYICNFSLNCLVAYWTNAWQLESSSVIAC